MESVLSFNLNKKLLLQNTGRTWITKNFLIFIGNWIWSFALPYPANITDMHTIINDAAFLNKGFHISTDKNLLDLNLIYNYLDKESYWAQGIPRERVEKAIENSLCFGIYDSKQQVGFARIITDKATFAYLCDVFVLTKYRRLGLSKWLLQKIVHHPELQGLRRWSLATADAHGLYKQFGFTELSKPDVWMEIHSPYGR